MSVDEPLHRPVMLRDVMEVLSPIAGGTFVDGTFGAGGYTRALLDAGAARVVAIDRDPTAIARGQSLSGAYGERLSLVEGRFSEMEAILGRAGIAGVDGVTLDVGFSSMQIDDAARGFSFAKDGPLDMRMGTTGPTAADYVNTLPEATLSRVLFVLGEERKANAIARAIVRARTIKPFERTGELAAVVERVLPKKPGERIHPATRTFQALRILVNAELVELAHGLAAAERVLLAGGRLAVVTFHSLEDRFVKQFLAKRTGKVARPSRHAPVVDSGPAPSFADLLPGGRTPSPIELGENPRARSARLRAGARTAAPAFPFVAADFGDPLTVSEAAA